MAFLCHYVCLDVKITCATYNHNNALDVCYIVKHLYHKKISSYIYKQEGRKENPFMNLHSYLKNM